MSPEDIKTLEVHREASLKIGRAIISLNYMEQALDHMFLYYHKMHEASLVMLPFMDFRAKITLIRDDEFLLDLVSKEIISRLHTAYDRRNVLAHGYLLITPEDDPKRPADGSSFLIKHTRRGQTLSELEIEATEQEASNLITALLEAREEIDEFVNPLMDLRQDFSHLSKDEFIAHIAKLHDDIKNIPKT